MIEASINHEKGYVQSKEMIDIYSTREPQLAFHQRISFCLDIHNMSVKVSTACPWGEQQDTAQGWLSSQLILLLFFFSRP